MKRFAALLLLATSAGATTIAPADIADAPPPMCWGGGICIATPPPPVVDLLDNHGAHKWFQYGTYIPAFGPNGHLFVSGGTSIAEVDTSLAVVRTFNRPQTSALTVAQNGDVYALSSAGVLTVYSPLGAVNATISLPFTTGSLVIPPSLDLGPDQCTLFYTDAAQTGRRFNVCGAQALPDLAPGAWKAVRALSDGGYVAASGSTISIFDAQNHLLRSFTEQIANINALAFDADPRFLLAGTETAIARIRLADGVPLESFGYSTLYMAVNGEQRAAGAALTTDIPTLSPALLLALAIGLIVLAWQRLRG